MISEDFITNLTSGADIVDYISNYVSVKKNGRISKACCPFHSEKTPSFMIYSDTQSFYCFGCGKGGDILTFIMLTENLDYVEAIHKLAKHQGVQVPLQYTDNTSKLKQQIYEINKLAAKYFFNLLKQPEGKIALQYFAKRGLDKKAITTFGLGYAKNDSYSLKNYLQNQGYTIEQILAAGLIRQGKNGSHYDYFRNRVMFPIIDLKGNVLGFGGRVLDDSLPKYLNSPDTLVFKKSHNLYSLNFAKKAAFDTLILAEGYMDVIAIYMAGFTNTVATLGTSLTTEQARIMAKYAKKIIIAYDADNAGQAAIHKALNYFSDLGLETRILNFQGAKDPDEYIKKFGILRFKRLIDNSSNVIEYELRALEVQHDLSTADGKIAYTKMAVKILSEIKNKVEKEIYANLISEKTSVPSQVLITQASDTAKRTYKAVQNKQMKQLTKINDPQINKINPQKGKYPAFVKAEEGLISVMFINPDWIDKILKQITPDQFITDFSKKIFQKICQINSQNRAVTISDLLGDFTREEINYISGFIAKFREIDENLLSYNGFIDCLLQAQEAITYKDTKNMSNDDLLKYIENLKNKMNRSK